MISIMLWTTRMKIHYTQNWYTWRMWQSYSTNGIQCARDCRGQKWHNQEPLINEPTLNYPQLSRLPSTTLTQWWILFFIFLSISSIFIIFWHLKYSQYFRSSSSLCCMVFHHNKFDNQIFKSSTFLTSSSFFYIL